MRRGAILAALLLAGCSADPGVEFPELASAAPADVLARRTGIRTLYAVLSIAYDGPDRSGTFDAVFYFRSPDSLRMTAFKDLVLSTEDVFDLVLAPEGYFLAAGEGEDRTVDRGALADFPDRQPSFAVFYWVREGLALPGRLDGPASVQGTGGGPLLVEGRLSSGAAVVWRLDPRTARVEEGRVRLGPEREVGIAYSDYRRAGEVFLPGRVVVEDPAGGVRVEARLVEFEVDPELETWLFDPNPPEPSPDGRR